MEKNQPPETTPRILPYITREAVRQIFLAISSGEKGAWFVIRDERRHRIIRRTAIIVSVLIIILICLVIFYALLP